MPRKKTLEKCQFFDLNDGLTTLEKCQFLDFITLLFFSLERAFFYSRISWKTFSLPIWPKKRVWKNGHFCTKMMGLPLWKKVNFSTFWTSCYYSLERLFFVLEYPERNFPGLYCLKKSLEKWPFLDLNHRLTPLEKCQFFDFLNFLFL